MSDATTTPASPPAPGPVATGVKMLTQAYRVELIIFAVSFLALMMFSGQRFLRQSAAPHFVYQAKSWLEGRVDIDAEVLPNIEDWACVRDVGGVRQRCAKPPLTTDHWFSSFPAFPSVVMLPFVVIHGYQLNDTSFGVIIGALALAFFYSLLRLLSAHEGTGRNERENAALALLLGFGTVFFYCAIRGEVWFSAEVMGVGLTALYLRNAVGARRPALAGLFWSMAVLTRTPLLFTGIFFALEVICPTRGSRREELRAFFKEPGKKLGPFKRFVMGAAPLGVLAAINNQVRFGSLSEFGHRFLFDNRVNGDIDTWGLFSTHYLARNLDAAFALLPEVHGSQLFYNPWGMSLFVTFPLIALLFVPSHRPNQALGALSAMAAVLVCSVLMPELPPMPGEFPVGSRSAGLWVVVLGCLGLLVFFANRWVSDATAPRLAVPLLITIAVTLVPGLLYQNTGYAQFGFRFSLDYTPYLVLLLAVGNWNLKKPLPLALAATSVVVGVWGAVGFRGYTELMRNWN